MHAYKEDYQKSKKGLLFRNNIVMTSFLGSLKLDTDGEMVVEGNRFLPYPDFNDFGAILSPAAPKYEAPLFLFSLGKAKFTKNFVSARHAISTGVGVLYVLDELTISDNLFEMIIPVTTAAHRTAVLLYPVPIPYNLNFINNEVGFDNPSGNKNFIALTLAGSHTLDTVKLDRNTTVGKYDATHLLFRPTTTPPTVNLMIGNLYLGKHLLGINGAIPTGYLSTVFAPTYVSNYYNQS
jgi:hypothetical protein